MRVGDSIPDTAPSPAFAAHEAAFAVPVRREGASSPVAAPDVAASFGPVLEVVSLAPLYVFVVIVVRDGADGSWAALGAGEQG
jgi:hypothetical protein